MRLLVTVDLNNVSKNEVKSNIIVHIDKSCYSRVFISVS